MKTKYNPKQCNDLQTVIAFVLLVSSPLALAIEPTTPNVGNLLQQIQPATPVPPTSNETGLTIEESGKAAKKEKAQPEMSFEIKSISIFGNEKIDTPTLHALVADAEGKNITLTGLQGLAARITDYYHNHGFIVSQAYLPEQDIQQGVVRIDVLEVKYSKILFDNHSRVDTSLLEDTLANLKSGQIIESPKLNHDLFLLSDIPGLSNTSVLKPGETPGTSSLVTTSNTLQNVSGNLQVDNYGNRYTGRTRGSANFNIYNPFQHGDVLSIGGLSTGEGMDYGNLSYETLVNGQGTRAGAAYTALQYQINGALSALHATGDAQIGNVWAKHPLIRSRDFNLFGRIDYDHVELRDKIGVGEINTFRHLDFGALSLSGDALDQIFNHKTISDSETWNKNTWNLIWTAGNLSFDNPDAQIQNAATAKTQGLFSKWNANYSRIQTLTTHDQFYLAFSGQWAMDNLDSSRKLIVGGPYTVRAYDMGAITADTGYIGTAEFRHHLDDFGFGRWTAVAFADSAYVVVNAHTWSGGPNNATLSGAGAGLNWLSPKVDWVLKSNLYAKAYVAAPFGPTPTLIGTTDSVRGWAEIGLSF
jgi:hemolysin activation/secretion protein